MKVEDGSGVAGANTYVTPTEAREYLNARGMDFPADDAEGARLLLRAMDYLESLRDSYQGSKTSPTNPLQWPRSGVTIDGHEFPHDAIPVELRIAQMFLASDAMEMDLMPTGEGKEVIAERVEGAVDVKYAETGNSNQQPKFTRAQAYLKPLLKRAGWSLVAVRV